MVANEGSQWLDPGEVSVECHVRAPVLVEPVDEHVETLRTLSSTGGIGDFTLRGWTDRAQLTADSPNRDVVEVFRTFERWARRNGVSVRPPFEIRERTNIVTDRQTEHLVTPLICLALYAAGRLVGVYPHSLEEETYTVTDAVETLRDGSVPVPLTAGRAAVRDRCPGCAGRLVNGQGVYACVRCEWAGFAPTDGRYVRLKPAEPG